MLLVNYGDGMWQELVILRPASPVAFQSVREDLSGRLSLPYWVATPDADVYPEELDVPPLAGRRVFLKTGSLRAGWSA